MGPQRIRLELCNKVGDTVGEWTASGWREALDVAREWRLHSGYSMFDGRKERFTLYCWRAGYSRKGSIGGQVSR